MDVQRGKGGGAKWKSVLGRCAERALSPLRQRLGACGLAHTSVHQHVEALERRQLLAVTPVISEFMALNYQTLANQEGKYYDWIEIQNPSASAIDLKGYYLTDDKDVLKKWEFPSTVVPRGGYLVVFASELDRKVPGQELHTNFALKHTGGYLALVGPDGPPGVGNAIVSEYSPEYPEQLADTSYGRTVDEIITKLVPAGAEVKTLIPSSSSLGSTWRAVSFDDSSWTVGKTGVGFETVQPPPQIPGFTVKMIDCSTNDIYNIGVAQSILNGPLPGGAIVSTKDYAIVNLGTGGHYGGEQTLPNGFGATGDDVYAPQREQYVLRIAANVVIPAGQWTINVNSDDGFLLRIPGVQFTNRVGEEFSGATQPSPADTLVYGTPRGASDTMGTFTVPDGGLTTTLQLDFYERGGGDCVELDVARYQKTAHDGTFSLLGDGLFGWSVKTTSSTPAPNYKTLIGTDTYSKMQSFDTAYIRIPFALEDTPAFDTLRLRMKYDDGFVAYLNGTEVARRNAPATPLWNSSATGAHPDGQAINYEDIDISAFMSALRVGNNVLAIQGLNKADDRTDFLIYPELAGIMMLVNQERYFTNPTPRKANDPSSILGIVEDTKFDHDRGFYSAPFNLKITSATPGAQIRYTTDGTPPTATNGELYTGPITISRTTTLRAVAYKTGYLPTNSDTQTYIFVEDVIRQSPNGEKPTTSPDWPAPGYLNGQMINYGMDQRVVNNALYATTVKTGLTSIPTFSIVMDLKDMFDPARGFYVNPWGDGRDWERLASIELINPDGSKGFQINGGVRLRGGYSRSGDNPKHGFHFFFRNAPGYDGPLDFPVFGPDGANQFDRFDLRCGQNYSWSFGGDGLHIALRDQVNRDLQEAMGQPAPRGNFYHLYINGQYWGLFDTDERPSASNAANLYGGSEDDYDVIKVDPDLGYNIEPLNGNLDAWTSLWSQLRGNISSLDNYMKVQGKNPDGMRNPAYPVLLDVDNLIDYMLVIFYGGNLDAPLSAFLSNTAPNNFFALRNRNGDEGFKFFVHDAEHTLLNVNEDRTGPFNTIDPDPNTALGRSNPQYMFQLLTANPEFRLRVADRIHQHFFNNGVLTSKTVTTLFNKRKAEIDKAIVDESARWGDAKRPSQPFTRNVEWLAEVNRIVSSYIPQRTNTVLNQLKADGLYPAVAAPEYNKAGGMVASGFQVTIRNPGGSGTIYYTTDGSDPRLPGGAVSPGAQTYTSALTITQTTRVIARILKSGTWSAITDFTFTLDMAALRITEVMYHPADPAAGSPYTAEDFEYIEFKNTGDEPLGLQGIRLTDGVGFTFPDITLEAGARTVIVKDEAAFRSRYGALVPIAGVYGGSLKNEGETIRVEGPLGQLIEQFTYNNSWFNCTEGEGFSLVALDPLASDAVLSSKEGWRPSFLPGGAPGGEDPGLAPDSVVINEIQSHPTIDVGDWIELANTTDSAIDISGWFLSDSDVDLRKYEMRPGTVIPTHGFIVFRQADHFGNAGAPGVHTVFAFSELGDQAYLTSGVGGVAGGYRESVDFGAANRDITFGRYTKSTGKSDFVAMSAPTPREANAYPLVGPVVINEIMYNPPVGGIEYIELRNITGSAVPLYDPLHPANTWQFTSGIVYTFTTGDQIPAYGYALVVQGSPSEFRTKYGIPQNVPIFGPYTGLLNNAGDTIELLKPGMPEDTGYVPYVTVERIKYGNAAPWPTEPNGGGTSLSRIESDQYGNDVANWTSDLAGGSPGRNNIDLIPPAAVIIAVSPDPRDTPVDSITIYFDEAVVGFDLVDLTLSRDGGPNLLTGTQTLSNTGDGQTFVLGNLQPLTSIKGSYVLTLNAAGSGIEDLAGNALAEGAARGFMIGADSISGTPGDDSFHLRALNGNLQVFVNIPPGSNPTYSFPLSQVSRLTLNGGDGNDTVVIGSALPFTPVFNGGAGTNRLSILAGSYTLGQDANGLEITVDGADPANTASLTFTSSQHLAILSLSGAARAILVAGGDKVFRTNSLNISGAAALDLADNDLILQATAESCETALAKLFALVRSGRRQGVGVISSTAAGNTVTGLAVCLNDIGGGLMYSRFDNEPVDASSVLVKYTWNGDMNLDGVVNADDYFLIDTGFITQGTVYRNGDLNYDGVANADDYFMIDSAFLGQSAPLSSPVADDAEEGPVVALPSAAAMVVSAGQSREEQLSLLGARSEDLFSTVPVR